MQRYFKLLGLQSHRSASFTLSTDQFFIEKLRDVVGLYLSPPEHALVLCVDEKSQGQALERTQPVLPMGFGYVEGVTHDGSSRHNHAVCCTERAQRHRARYLKAAPPASGVAVVFARNRQDRPR